MQSSFCNFRSDISYSIIEKYERSENGDILGQIYSFGQRSYELKRSVVLNLCDSEIIRKRSIEAFEFFAWHWRVSFVLGGGWKNKIEAK